MCYIFTCITFCCENLEIMGYLLNYHALMLECYYLLPVQRVPQGADVTCNMAICVSKHLNQFRGRDKSFADMEESNIQITLPSVN